ncbi:MAG TPA: ATPase, T2SS/T4P/T4SS family [Candidatus Paceibacterota bacterium]|nr:ATPase, T2SS/T4P/T4SS family [Candidatus Paceibacterota bacterium]HMP19169.1 ATPase, T2SS/T4P/T4SS family [Candidatus Paceibacterota bacterium]HMP85220.1 ATPase, T2SS/T4P/T4SS family [Candidatus Paceibacterota bacterium]
MSLADFVIEKGLLDEESLKRMISDMKKTGDSFENILLKNDINLQKFLEIKSEYYKVPISNINPKDISFELLKYIPEESARHYKFAPIGKEGNILLVGMVEPGDIKARDALNFISSKEDTPFKILLISEDDLEQILEVYKGLSGEVTKALGELEVNLSEEDVITPKPQANKKDDTKIIEDAPVTKIVATILKYAVEGGASDVHIESMKDKVRVRFRVDGVLNTSLVLPAKVLSALVARVKILSQMKLDEKRKPQDGRFSARIENRKIDFRVSTFPSYYGEKVVMRILDQEKGIKTIEELGLSDRNYNMLKKAIEKPYGMILISGPTGSGKSTTLYSVLKEIDRDGQNVLSLEDPVEYSIDGVSQSQVFPEIGYTFATGLRTTLRQDPDIIMVGEIRDSETAKLAIQAALTGHLVLSTIHTNTSAGIVPRLIDMGVDPYLIAPTLILGVAQRLARKIGPDSGEPVKIEGSIKQMLEKQFSDLPEQYKTEIPQTEEMLKIKPTPTCPTGTRGREAVFEMYEMDRDLEQIILNNPTENAIYDQVRKKGMLTMKEDAIIKALKKQIPFEEINKL